MAQQLDLFAADAWWFSIFREMIDTGDAARMGGTAFLVYAVVKAYANYSTGYSCPTVEKIAAKAGISIPQTERHLRSLMTLGYIRRDRIGRKNSYSLVEKIQLYDRAGQPSAVATWDYLPAKVKDALAELNTYMVEGRHSGQVIHIDRLVLAVGDNAKINVVESVQVGGDGNIVIQQGID